MGSRQTELQAQRRQARWLGAFGFAVAMAVPVLLFKDVVWILAEQPKATVTYMSGWLPWILLSGGLMFLLPVAWSAGMDPESRWFPRARAAYAGWGLSLYILGFFLAWQVMRIQGAAFG